MNEFFRNSEGQSFLIEITVYEKGSSEIMQSYFDKVVIPAVRKVFLGYGDRRPTYQIVKWIEEEHFEGKSWRSVSSRELAECIEEIIIFCGENCVAVDEPLKL